MAWWNPFSWFKQEEDPLPPEDVIRTIYDLGDGPPSPVVIDPPKPEPEPVAPEPEPEPVPQEPEPEPEPEANPVPVADRTPTPGVASTGNIPAAWLGQDFAALGQEIAKPEYEGLTDSEIVSAVLAKTVPYVASLGFDPNDFHEGMVIHARRGGGI